MQPNRVAVYLTALAGLVGAVAVPVANLDTSSTIGVLGGLATILGVVSRWLDGWQKHERRLALDDDADDLEGDHEHPAAADLPTADPARIPADEGDIGGQP